jgi:hypothetical protein
MESEDRIVDLIDAQTFANEVTSMLQKQLDDIRTKLSVQLPYVELQAPHIKVRGHPEQPLTKRDLQKLMDTVLNLAQQGVDIYYRSCNLEPPKLPRPVVPE